MTTQHDKPLQGSYRTFQIRHQQDSRNAKLHN